MHDHLHLRVAEAHAADGTVGHPSDEAGGRVEGRNGEARPGSDAGRGRAANACGNLVERLDARLREVAAALERKQVRSPLRRSGIGRQPASQTEGGIARRAVTVAGEVAEAAHADGDVPDAARKTGDDAAPERRAESGNRAAHRAGHIHVEDNVAALQRGFDGEVARVGRPLEGQREEEVDEALDGARAVAGVGAEGQLDHVDVAVAVAVSFGAEGAAGAASLLVVEERVAVGIAIGEVGRAIAVHIDAPLAGAGGPTILSAVGHAVAVTVGVVQVRQAVSVGVEPAFDEVPDAVAVAVRVVGRYINGGIDRGRGVDGGIYRRIGDGVCQFGVCGLDAGIRRVDGRVFSGSRIRRARVFADAPVGGGVDARPNRATASVDGGARTAVCRNTGNKKKRQARKAAGKNDALHFGRSPKVLNSASVRGKPLPCQPQTWANLPVVPRSPPARVRLAGRRSRC